MNSGSRRCSTWAFAASAAWSSTSIRGDLAAASHRWRRPAAGGRRSTGGSSVGRASSSSPRGNGVPQVNPGTIFLLFVAGVGAAWAAGLFRAQYEDGRLTLRVLRAGRVLAAFAFRNTGLLLVLALLMGWTVAAAVERSGSGWGGPGTEGRLVPALAMTTVLGWIFIVAGFSRLGYLIASLAAAILALLVFTPSPLTSPSVSLAALLKWLQALPDQTTLLLLMGLILMFALTGLWTGWWIFRRRGG